MNADYIYDIFKTTEETESNDLHIGLAKLAVDEPIPEGMTEEGINRFLARHYDELVKAYADRDREDFRAAVEELLLADEAAEN